MAFSSHVVLAVTLSAILSQAILVKAAEEKIKECFPSKEDDGCLPGVECCIPEMEFFKVSKRAVVEGEVKPEFPELLDPVYPWGERQGRCIAYFTEGENCYSMASWTVCGCAEGMTCKYTPHPDEEIPGFKRAIPPWLRPKGTSACAKV